MNSVTETTLTLFGQTIRYLEAGNGPEVFLLHAAGADASEWSKVVEPLAAHYHVIVPDLLGHGHSSKPFINYRIDTFADVIEGMYQELGLTSATLIGHSASGAAAATVALRHPAWVRSLVLVDAGYAYAVPQVADVQQLGHTPGTLQVLSPATREQARQLYLLGTYTPPSEKDVDTLFEQSLPSAFAMSKLVESFGRREDVLDNRLTYLTQPTLIIWGQEDRITPVALGERMRREIAHAQLVVIENSGHSPNIEQPDRFTTVVLQFLQNIA